MGPANLLGRDLESPVCTAKWTARKLHASPLQLRLTLGVSLRLVAFRAAIGISEDKEQRMCKFCIKHGKNVAKTFET